MTQNSPLHGRDIHIHSQQEMPYLHVSHCIAATAMSFYS